MPIACLDTALSPWEILLLACELAIWEEVLAAWTALSAQELPA